MKDVVEIIQSIVTTIAIVVGSLWALYEFGLKRVSQPRLTVDHAIVSYRVTSDYRLIHLSVMHENKGDSLVRIGSADIRLQRIIPLPEFVHQALSEQQDPIRGKERVVRWPLLCRFTTDDEFELEPDEIQEMTFEFIIPANVQRIKIYTYFPNAAKADLIGWSRTTIYDVPDEGEAGNDGTMAAHLCARDL